ncbi:MAG: spheroidene monooxygenase [Ilumatobacteraceae bacterium]|nr:spheroidene monooxygenase [Ilumatobacteraceae bacterium]
MARVASFHLISETRWLTPLALARLATDRPRLARVPGLRFWRLLGTAHADDTAGGADLHRTALFAVWNDETDLEAFLRTHRIARRWGDATEAWHVRLRAAGGHGTWRGVDVLDGLEAGSDGGPLAIITRADVRRRSWRTFRHAARVVDTELHQADGLLAVVGVGEAPIGRLGTFSLWDSLDAAASFARRSPEHVEVIRRTRREHWYGEELFARFEPYASEGSWNGRDPLDGQPAERR